MAQTYKLRSATKLSIGSRCIMLMEILTLLSFLEEKACLKQGKDGHIQEAHSPSEGLYLDH